MDTAAAAAPQRERADQCAQDDIEVRRLDRRDEAAWMRYAARHPQASLYHGLAWREAIRDVFGHDSHYLLARHRAGGVVGVLPLVRLRSRLFGDFMASLPYVNYGGALADSPAIAERLMHEAARIAAEVGSRHVEFRDTRRYPAWPARTDKVIMQLPLPPCAEDLWRAFDPKLRAQIRRPEKAGVHATLGGAELLPAFYRVFARNMRDLGTPVYGREFFYAVMRAFVGSATIAVCHRAGEPVAAGILLRHGTRLEIPWASSLREHNRLGVNMALYWRILTHAIDQGCGLFDFGRCTVGSGTYRFKRQWGALERPLFWHYWLENGAPMPQLTPQNPKYRIAVAAWRRLPLFVANRLGPVLVKNLP